MKCFFIFLVILIFSLNSLLFAAPTDTEIMEAASILEVPYDDLLQFVQSYQTRDIASGTITVTAEALCSEYLASELAANNKYKGKIILLTGKLVEVKTDFQGRYYASLEGVKKNYVSHTIDVYFKDSELNRLANVQPGQTISILGKCTGEKGYLSFRLTDANFAM